ncbi:CHRD domain-containing protein [Streptomyces sp. NPDC015171]|uniref:CHRD domain-containing protein n=1 Tax=Streptomyces sp. NPDC015171 TaxID=3364945 RepID=UPI0036FAAD6C
MNNAVSGRRGRLTLAAVAVAAAAGVAAAVIPAHAATSHDGNGSGTTVLAAALRGAAEVPVEGGPAVGDKDGAALELLRVRGDEVSVAVIWRRTGRPVKLHIHEGAEGTNGDVKIDFTHLLDGAEGHTFTGTVTVEDPALLRRLTTDPGSFYTNLHTAEFPGGAVRGQLHTVTAAGSAPGAGG